jgi:hypothetical protein
MSTFYLKKLYIMSTFYIHKISFVIKKPKSSRRCTSLRLCPTNLTYTKYKLYWQVIQKIKVKQQQICKHKYMGVGIITIRFISNPYWFRCWLDSLVTNSKDGTSTKKNNKWKEEKGQKRKKSETDLKYFTFNVKFASKRGKKYYACL